MPLFYILFSISASRERDRSNPAERERESHTKWHKRGHFWAGSGRAWVIFIVLTEPSLPDVAVTRKRIFLPFFEILFFLIFVFFTSSRHSSCSQRRAMCVCVCGDSCSARSITLLHHSGHVFTSTALRALRVCWGECLYRRHERLSIFSACH